MTNQVLEFIIITDEVYSCMGLPLQLYLEGLGQQPDWGTVPASCQRGYVGTWKLSQDRLWLVELKGGFYYADELDEKGRLIHQNMGVSHFFPGKETVFAEWFSGNLIVWYSRDDLRLSAAPGYWGDYSVFFFENGIMVQQVDHVQER